MKRIAFLLLLVVPLAAQDKATTGFETWWKRFQASIVKKDAALVTQRVRFPMPWEDGPTREIKAAADISARFDFYFTPEIKKIIATRKPVADGPADYTITWKARGNEYSLYFKNRGLGWALDGLSEGPP
jgi:hypothetical protein